MHRSISDHRKGQPGFTQNGKGPIALPMGPLPAVGKRDGGENPSQGMSKTIASSHKPRAAGGTNRGDAADRHDASPGAVESRSMIESPQARPRKRGCSRRVLRARPRPLACTCTRVETKGHVDKGLQRRQGAWHCPHREASQVARRILACGARYRKGPGPPTK